jgi:hypothetical protein
MPLRSDKKTLQGNIQPWRCDLCAEPFEPDLHGICSRCGRLCCPDCRTMASNPAVFGGREAVCKQCEDRAEAPGGGSASE